MIDTHAHMDDKAFESDLAYVLENAKREGVKAIISVSESVESSKRALFISQESDILRPAVGCHPQYADSLNDTAELEKLASDPHVVAIGETGLDFYKNFSIKENQFKAFEFQISLAKKLGKPLSVHCRDAHKECYEMLKSSGTTGVMHCYSGSRDMVDKFIEIGFYISFAGPITFKNALNLQQVMLCVPKDKLLVETDSPVLSPHPHRGERNEPSRLQLIVSKIAELLNISVQDVIDLTTQNAKRVFKL